MRRIRTAIVLRTRPEAIKLLSVIRRMQADERFVVRTIVTGQHGSMPQEILRPFGIVPDADLAIMRPRQTLNEILRRAIPALEKHFAQADYDVVVVQGDTTSAFAAALVAFYGGISVAHVEAGLRSFDRFNPYPEEANRRMLSALSDLHFAPTAQAAENLLREGVLRDEIVITGNTVVDACMMALAKLRERRHPQPRFKPQGDGRMVLVTLHRREAWQQTPRTPLRLDGILEALRKSAADHPTVDFVFPVHSKPAVRDPVQRVLKGRRNIVLIGPQSYVPFVELMSRATVILTDSGGIQEEAPTLRVPVIVARQTTERPEGLSHERNRLGDSPEEITKQLARILASPPQRGPLPGPNPFGDGHASERIHQALLHFRGLGSAPTECGDPQRAPMPVRRLRSGTAKRKG